MAINIYNQPNSANAFAVPIYPHAVTGKLAATFGSDAYETYIDFAYYVEVENFVTNKTTKNLVPPLSDNGYSYIDVVKAVNKNVYYEYNPGLTAFSAATKHMGKYNIKVSEFYNNSIQATSVDIDAIYANTSLAVYYKEEFYQWNPIDYQMRSTTSKFLTNIANVSKVKLNDEGVWKAYYGGTQVILGNRSFFDELKIEVYKSNGTIYHYTLENNVDWVNITNAGETDASKNTVEFPVMPSNLRSTDSIVLNKIELENGYTFYPNTTGGVNLEVGDSYVIYSYSKQSPYLNERTSQKYTFQIECAGKNDFEVSWENEFGGTDYYNFSNLEAVTMSNKVKTYNNSRDNWLPFSTDSDFEFAYGMDKKKRETIYSSEYSEKFNLTSRLLSSEEVLFVDTLFYSKNIEIRIDGEWFPALASKATQKLINSKKQGLKFYQFEIIVDKDKNLL